MAMRPGDSQGDGWGARERDLQDPLCLLLLVLFLQEQEKYRQNLRKLHDHLLHLRYIEKADAQNVRLLWGFYYQLA